VNLPVALWFGVGGVLSSLWNTVMNRPRPHTAGSPGEGEALPEDMSTTSLFGGGLIAGDAIAALAIGIAGLVATVFVS
jgi:hypothetical protein